MKLIELVNYFRTGGSFKKFCKNQSLELESEVIEIYMEKPFDIGNEIVFFEIEKTEGKLEYTTNGIQYFNLFDFYFFLDAIEESNNDQNRPFTNEEISNKLFDFAINDA